MTMVLIILDGWGYREESQYNAILNANTPHWDQLWASYPHTLLSGCGTAVGLPEGQMGNSEVGHMNMGAGRVVHQELSRISNSIKDKTFASNPRILSLLEKIKQKQSALHVMGLLSAGGIHSHEKHIHAMLQLAKDQGIERVYLHAFLDGRDTPPQSAEASLVAAMQYAQIATISGRYYAMDRDNRWQRIEGVYNMLVQGESEYYCDDVVSALKLAYARNETDEFVKPTAIYEKAKPIRIEDNDGIMFMNFRADRARQLTKAFTEQDFNGFERAEQPRLSGFVTLTEYAADLTAEVAFMPQRIENSLGQVISDQGMQQLRIAETEKYAHVTFFFNGGLEVPFAGEDRKLIPSPKVATYDLQPEMSALRVTEELCKAIKSKQYQLIICNFANADMVGHSGNYEATISAIETIDYCVGDIHKALKEAKAEMIITADHGNADIMFNEKTEQPHTAHTHQPVPCLYVGRAGRFIREDGTLADIAPTVLHLMGIDIPTQMSGHVLFEMS